MGCRSYDPCNPFQVEQKVTYLYGFDINCSKKVAQAKAILDQCPNIKKTEIVTIHKVFGPLGHQYLRYTYTNGKQGEILE